MPVDKELISELKNKYGRIYSAKILGTQYLFRPLKVSEFSVLIDKTDLDTEEDVAHQIILYPENTSFDDLPIGFVSTLLTEAIRVSGFADPQSANNLLLEKRKQAGTIINHMKAMVIAAQPTITKDALGEMTFEELIEEVVFSEKVLEIISGATNPAVESIELVIQDPEVIAEQEASRDPVAEKLHRAMAESGML